ncbi:MAG: hypothetical protein ACO1PZ_08130 [Gammaproteobacteria bacterium]
MLPFYYDSQLTIPAFIADGRAYTARLGLLAGSPPVFELQLLEPAQAGAAHDDNVYGDGLLTLPRVVIGAEPWRATLAVSGTRPLRLQVVDLHPAE